MIEGGLSCGGICGEEDLQELPWRDTLSSGGLHQTRKDAVGFEPAFRSRSEADFAEDHQIPESLFRVIVRRRDAGVPEKGEEEFLLGSDEIAPESLGGSETKRSFADVVQFCNGAFFEFGRLFPGNIARFEFLSHVAES